MLKTFKATRYACYMGSMTQAIIVNLAPIFFIIFQTQFGISDEQTGRLILVNFATQIVADIIATRYGDRMGYRASAIAAVTLCFVGLLSLSILPGVMPNPYAGLLISTVVYATGGGFLEVMISPIVESLPGDEKATAMSLLHSFYCWGQALVVLGTTLALWAFGHSIWRAIPLVWSLLPLAAFFMFTRVPLLPTVSEHEKTSVRQLFSSRIFILALLMMMASGSSELTMSQWSSLFAEKGLGVSKIIGDLLGPCLFALMMGVVRAFYGINGSKINLNNALIISGALCIVCYGMAIFFNNPFLSLAGCALCGISVALMWPGTLSMTAAMFPVGGATMFGILAIFGDVGGSIGPWLAGFSSDWIKRSSLIDWISGATNLGADQIGLKAGLLVGMIFPILLFIGALMMRKERTKPLK